MAKKSMIVKNSRKPKFKVREYTRCTRCGIRCNKKCLGGLMAHQGTGCIYDAARKKEEKQ